MEIERKFLLYPNEHLQNLVMGCESHEIVQGYLSVNPEIRIRKLDHDYFLTTKSKGALLRKEVETRLSQEAYYILLNLCSPIIRKTRYIMKLGNSKNVAEIDVFKTEALKGLVLVEVEFDTLCEANNFVPPKWFGKEVTNNPNYKNKNLLTYFKNHPANKQHSLYKFNLKIVYTNVISIIKLILHRR
jgi:CYTH domain-containing protein